MRKEDTEDIKVVRSGSSVRVASCIGDNCCSSVYALFLYVRHYEIKIDI